MSVVNFRDVPAGKFYVVDRSNETADDYSAMNIIAGPFDTSEAASAEKRRKPLEGSAAVVMVSPTRWAS